MSDAREDFEAATKEHFTTKGTRAAGRLAVGISYEDLRNMHRLAERIKKDNVASDPAWLLAEIVTDKLYDPREDE